MKKQYLEIVRSLLPAVLFLIVFKVYSYNLALMTGLAIGTAIYGYTYKKKGVLSALDKIGLLSLIIQSVIGLIANNEKMYFAYPLVQSTIITIILFISLYLKDDIISLIAKDFNDKEDRELMRPTYRKLTVMWGLFFLIRTAVKVIGLLNWSFEILYTVNWILGTPVTVALIYLSFTYPNRIYRGLKAHNNKEILNH